MADSDLSETRIHFNEFQYGIAADYMPSTPPPKSIDMIFEEEKCNLRESKSLGEKENQLALFKTTLLKSNLQATKCTHYKFTIE